MVLTLLIVAGMVFLVEVMWLPISRARVDTIVSQSEHAHGDIPMINLASTEMHLKCIEDIKKVIAEFHIDEIFIENGIVHFCTLQQ
jgi:hypothetical protein